MLQMLVDQGYLDASLLEDEAAHETEIIEALYRGLKGSEHAVHLLEPFDGAAEDAVVGKRLLHVIRHNTQILAHNWRIPLADANGAAVMLEDLFQGDLLQRITKIMNS